jgi:hypothetical protein
MERERTVVPSHVEDKVGYESVDTFDGKPNFDVEFGHYAFETMEIKSAYTN